MSSKLALVAVTLLLTCGCRTGYTKHIGEEDPGFGETAKYDAAAQIINPDPVYAQGGAQPGDSGVKAAAALKRYRTDAVKQVEMMQTTSGTGTGSGSGSTH
jgi:hypothetical protein